MGLHKKKFHVCVKIKISHWMTGFIIKRKDNKVVIKVGLMQELNTKEVARFFLKYEQIVKQNKDIVVFLDGRTLDMSINTLSFVTEMIAFFVRIAPISEQNVLALAICVSNKSIAAIIQKGSDAHVSPTKVPLCVHVDMKKCKQFLTTYH
jgi:hypothetical protein